MARRQRVDLEAAQYVQVLDALPMHANRAATDFISYPSTNFKHSPKWQHCSKYKPAVAKLFEFSGGKNANQNSFLRLQNNTVWIIHLGLHQMPSNKVSTDFEH